MRKILLIFIFIFISNSIAFGETLPNVVAEGAILVDFATGRILYERNAHKKMPMASTTKIMTAIIALEMGNLDDIVTVSARAASAPEVSMDLVTGEQIRLEFLLYALMLSSYNDAAVAIAEHVAGSVEAFCNIMTEKAISLGAYNTVFETPSGLDTDNHYSTAYDLALIARYAFENEKFVEIINDLGREVYTDRRSYYIFNRNRLLQEFEGGNGVKTGYTGGAGHCFVGAAKRDDMQLISVVLASGWGNAGKAQKWVDTRILLTHGFDNFEYQDVIDKGQVAGSTAVERGRINSVTFSYAEDFYLPMTEEELASVRVIHDYPDIIEAPVFAGDKIGIAQVIINCEVVKEIPLLINYDIARHDFFTSVKKILNAWFRLGARGNMDLIT